MKSIRCFHFDENGIPRMRASGPPGCPRGDTCHFVHPTDKDWAIASSSRVNPYYGGPTHPRPHTPSPPRDRRRIDDGYTYIKKKPLSVDTHPVDTQHRRESVGFGRAPERSPARTTASAEAREGPRSRFAPVGHAPSGLNGTNSKRPDPALETGKRPTSTVARPPPMSQPTLSSTKILSNGHAAQNAESKPPPPRVKEPPFEDKRAAMIDRIRLMSEAVVIRTEHLRLQKEMQSYQRLMKSRRFFEVSETDKAQMDSQLADITRQCEEKKTELNTLIVQLTGADVWPAEQLGQRILDGNPMEIKASIVELRANVKQIFDVLRNTTGPNAGLSAMSATMDRNEPSGPPSKRRRLSPNIDQSAASTSFLDRSQSEANGTDDLLDMLQKFEGRLSDLENDMVQIDNGLLDEVDERIAYKLEALHGPPSQLERQLQSDPTDQKVAVDTMQSQILGSIKVEIDTLGDQVGELAEEVAALILQMRAKDEEHTRLQQQFTELIQEVDTLKQLQRQNQTVIEENKQETRALSAAVTAQLSRSPDPPSIPQLPDIETIVAAVQPLVLQSIREDLKPLLSGTHSSVQAMLQDQNAQVLATVLAKMSTTVKTVEAVSDWMERIRRGELVIDRPADPGLAQTSTSL